MGILFDFITKKKRLYSIIGLLITICVIVFHLSKTNYANKALSTRILTTQTYDSIGKTRCNEKANLLGRGQKVVSYSWYRNVNESADRNQDYERGIRRNLAGIRAHYGAGWSMRLYTNQNEEDQSKFSDLIHNTTDFFWCDVTKMEDSAKIVSSFGMVWRFIPIDDDSVDIFLSRDLDSPILSREREAVKEWEESDKIFHFMRDHRYHFAPIMGGMWGAKVALMDKKDRKYLLSSFLNHILHRHQRSGSEITKKFLYTPRILDVSLAHDNIYCPFFIQTLCKNFPSPRLGTAYVGGYEDED